MSEIKILNERSKADTTIFDFLTHYINISHNKLLNVMYQMIVLVLGDDSYVTLTKFGAKWI